MEGTNVKRRLDCALFNRESTPQTRVFNFSSELGLTNGYVRNLWDHEDLGIKSLLAESIPTHGCKIYRVSAETDQTNAPLIDMADGTYSEPFTLTMSCATEGAAIYYTLDGSDPSETSARYTQPFTVEKAMIVKAIAIKTGQAASFLSARAYSFGSDMPEQLEMYVGGSFNDWTLGSMPMEYKGDHNWESQAVELEKDSYELKFANNKNWTGDDWGDATGLEGTAKLTTGGKPNLKFTLTEAGHYYFVFNEKTLAYAIRKANDTAIGATDAEQISIYASANRQLIVAGAENATLVVSDLSGKIITHIRKALITQQLELQRASPGVYLINIVKEGKGTTYKYLLP